MNEDAERVAEACREQYLDVSVVDASRMTDNLIREADNVVVVLTEEKAFAMEQLIHLNAVLADYRITVIGLPRWDLMEMTDNEYLVKVNTHVVAPSFIDYQDERVKSFVRQYRERYKADPLPLAFEGFDAGFYFLTALHRFGKQFPDCLNEMSVKPLQSNFSFLRKDGGGIENQGWMIYTYDDYRLLPVY
jgi:hypothetical protein